jgi:MFS family permease
MNTVDWTRGLEQAWANFLTFAPKVLLAIVIIVAGYFIAKLVCQLFNGVLERVGFDRLVERGGIKRTLARSRYDASDLLAKLLFYTVMLFVLQLAFGIFGPNAISALLTSVIAFLPNLFAAILIVIVAAAIAAAVKDILQATLAGLTYGRFLANLAAVFIIATGIFAALNQINIAPAIVNGLFYALLAIVAGSAIIAIGGGGIIPMRAKWEQALRRMEQEAPQLRDRLQSLPNRAEQSAQAWKQDVAPAPQKPDHGPSFAE